jgi:hypothetical protein
MTFSKAATGYSQTLAPIHFGQMSHKKQELSIPTDWNIKRNEFYDIDPLDKSTTTDKAILIFDQEDLLWISKGDYNIDLGWYGGQDLKNKESGFCIHLFRGDNWNKCELLEKFISKSKHDIVDKLKSLIRSVDNGDYKELRGHKIDEDDIQNKNSMSDYELYSAKK